MDKKKLTLSDLAKHCRIEPVELPELDGIVYVRSFTAAKRLRLIEEHFDMKGGQTVPKEDKSFQLQFAVVRASLCDEDGRLIADNDDAQDALEQMSAQTLDRICEAAMELNGLRDQEAVAKNLPSQGDSSPSS